VAFWAAPERLALHPPRSALLASWYIVGAVLGSLVFGWATDRFGRRKLFFITLIIYLSGVMLTATAWNLWSFCLFRFLTGAGIGGEYSAINSAIDELIPARLRGRVDLIVNGSYWLGAAAGSLSTIVILKPALPAGEYRLAPWVRCRRGDRFGGPVPAPLHA